MHVLPFQQETDPTFLTGGHFEVTRIVAAGDDDV